MNTHTYLVWDEQTIDPTDQAAVDAAYDRGFVFGRLGYGKMTQVRSLRIKLADFETTSENRRILRKSEGVSMAARKLPIDNYHWSIGKLAKDFYAAKFGDGTFSANKVKELLTDSEKSSFNLLLEFSPYKGELEGVSPSLQRSEVNNPTQPPLIGEEPVGYTICHQTKTILHYSYPFYDLEKSNRSMGLGMMTKAIVWAKEQGLDYIYLGSFQRASDIYKLQFAGMEWFDGERWSDDLEGLKSVDL